MKIELSNDTVEEILESKRCHYCSEISLGVTSRQITVDIFEISCEFCADVKKVNRNL